MEAKHRATQKQIEGLSQALSELIVNKELRQHFLKKPTEALEKAGIKIHNPETEKVIIETIRDKVLTEVNLTSRIEGVDLGHVDPGVASVVVAAVVTGVTTAAATGVVSYTFSDIELDQKVRTPLVLDFTKIKQISDLNLKDVKGKGLKKDVKIKGLKDVKGKGKL